MATLRPIRAGVLVLGILALAPVLVSTCSPGGTSSGGSVVTLVGDDPVCYSDADIDAGTVPLPQPAAQRQYIYAKFTTVPTPQQRRELEPDVRFLDSLGKGAFSVRINTSAWSTGLQQLHALGADCLAELKNNNRASPLLFGDRSVLRGYDTTGPSIQITVYVRFWSDVPLSEQKTILTSVGGQNVDTLETFNDEWLVTLPDANLGDLIANGQVQWVEELDPAPSDDLDETRSAIGMPPDFANDGDGTVIAQWEVCHPANKAPDEHPDIANRSSTGLGQKLCTPTKTTIFPSNAHATQVAGILIGDGSASAVGGGVANQWRGIAPKASIVSYSVHSLDGSGLIDEYLDATQSMAVISSNSWGSMFDDYYHRPHSSLYAFRSALFDTVSSRRNAAGDPAGPGQRMLVVASSGNRGGDRVDPSNVNSDRIYWSTARIRNSAKNVLTVGNVTSGPDGKLGKPAFDTGRGPTKDGRLKPDLVAPGSQDVEPLSPKDPGVMSPVFPSNSANVSEFYAPGWGTSFSTPVVAGAAALLATTIQTGACNRNPTPAELRALLIHTADDLVDASDDAEYPSLIQNYTSGEYDLAKLEEEYFNADTPGFTPNAPYKVTDPPAGVDALVGPDYVFGFGMVQPAIADTLAANGNFLRASVTQGYIEFPIFVREADLDDGVLRVTLAWDDPPATRKQKSDNGLAVSLLQNDLDLVVVAPDGTRHMPWKLDPSQPTQPAVQETYGRFEFWPEEAGDHRNTIEQVAIAPDSSQLGQTWRIQVWGMDLLLPPQEFALASEIIQPAVPCADIPVHIEPNPVMPPRDWTYWVLFIIAIVVLLLLLLWLAELIYNAYQQQGKREAIIRVLIAWFVLLLIAVLLFNWLSGQPPDPV